MSPRTIKLVLQYDGTDFEGWQRQPAPARTVQAVIEDELAAILGEKVLVHGSGRTDSGVHARAQVAHFATSARIPVDGVRRGLNAGLPRDVAVMAAEEVPETFDARRSARGKHYVYRIWNHENRSPLHARTSWHVLSALDVPAMAEAGRHLLGEHDFSAFRAASCSTAATARNWRISSRQPRTSS